MKNLLAIVLVVALAAGAYVAYQQGVFGHSPSGDSVNDYVPADTLFYAGGLEPLSLEMMTAWTANYDMGTAAMLGKQEFQEMQQTMPTGAQIYFKLYEYYLSSMTSVDGLTQRFGMGKNAQLAMYTVGGIPVLRYQLADPASFDKLISELESEVAFNATPETVGNITYRLYPLSNTGEEYHLVIASNGSQAIFSIDTPLNNESDLLPVLGAELPQESILASGKLDALVKDYSFDKSYVSYIDHVEIIKGLTDPNSNGFGVTLAKLMQQDGSSDALSEIQTPECQQDMLAIAQNWPRTVYGQSEMTANKLSGQLIVESKQLATLQAIKTIRGLLPVAHTTTPSIMSMAYAIDLEKVAPFLSNMTADMLATSYQCGVLVDMQEELRNNNPAAAAVMLASVQDIKGIAASLVDFAFDTKGNLPMDLQQSGIAITLVANQPQNLLAMAGQFLPQLASASVPTDGTPVALSIPELPVPIEVAIKGNQMTFIAGEAARSFVTGTAMDQTKEGLFYMGMDYKKYGEFMGDVSTMIPPGTFEDQELLVESFKGLDMQLHMDTDVTDKGIVMTFDMTR